MPAPRNCRSCGEALSPDLRRCFACGAAVTEFAVRPPLHDDGFVGAPMHDIHTSRWRASDTTFGPAGRLVITAATVAFLLTGLWMMGLTPFGLWFFLGWSILAGHIFKQIWAPVRIDGTPSGARASLERRFPRTGRAVQPGVLLTLIVVAVGAAGIYAWIDGDTVVRFGIVLGLATLGLVSILLRLSDW
jgi:hypothetical protein